MASTCYYRTNIPGEYESGQRLKPFDLSLTACSSDLQLVSTFINQLHTDITLLGCHSVLELLNLRANGEMINEENEGVLGLRTICSDHFHTLVVNWEKGDERRKNLRQSRYKNAYSTVTCPLSHNKSVAASSSRIEMCVNYLKQEGVLVPPGTQLCKRCQGVMKCTRGQRGSKDSDFDPIADMAMDIDVTDEEMENKTDEYGRMPDLDSSPIRVKRNISPEIISAVTQLVHSIGGDRGCCDRACAHCKRKINEWINSENNICNALNIFQALTVDNELIKGLSTYYCTLTDLSTKATNLLPGISHSYSFDFEDEGVRTRYQYGIGEGSVTKKGKLPSMTCTLTIEEEGGFIDSSFWSTIESKGDEKNNEEEAKEEEEVHDDDMLHCGTRGCTASFRSSRWLSSHEIIGKHIFVSKKESMTDRAISKFNELIETRETARIAVSEQVADIGELDTGYVHKKGWALKSANQITHGLSSTAKELAEEYFFTQRSLLPPRRAEPATMRKKLEESKDTADPTGYKYLLPYSHIPSEKQLQSLFSRLEQTRSKGTTSAKAAKVLKTAKGAGKSKTSARSKASVRSQKGGTRKRNVVVESEDSYSSDDAIEVENEEEEESNQEHEDDFIRKIIGEECSEIYL